MSPTLTEQAGTGISPPVRPSFWRVGWATFLGYALTFLLVIPLALLMGFVGIDIAGEGRGAFYRYDVWSWLAEACLGLLVTLATAWFVRDQLRDRTGWEVPLGFAFVTLLFTGYAPFLALTPFYGAAAPVSLAAAAFVLRWRSEPAGAEPTKALDWVPRRHRRKVAIGLALGLPLMFIYVVAYGATHPLHWEHGYSRTGLIDRHDPGKLTRYDLFLGNNGPAVKDVSIVRVEGTPALQLERVGIEANKWTVADPRHPTPPPMRPVGRDYRPGLPDPITLELRQGRVCPPGIAELEAVWVRYTVLGTRQQQRIPLEQPPGVRCP